MNPSTIALPFGALLKQLRKQSGMTQRDLAAALGYSESLISCLEKAQRHPDMQAVTERFIPALGLQDDPNTAAHLIEQAALARGERPPASVTFQRTTQTVLQDELRQAQLAEPVEALPSPPTELIGRAAEVNQLCKRLLGHSGRLLTLLGPPGIGKTRLGLAIAAQIAGAYQDGATFVPLAAIGDPDLVAEALVATLKIIDMGQKPTKVKLIEFLRRKEMLLLLDNFEQILGAAGVLAELLSECPGLRILVTSRERLHLRAEQRYQVPPLSLAVAIELFTQRAQAIDFAFELTVEQQPIVEAICQRLDCLPLAIELIAAHIDLFSLQAMLARLNDRHLDLLADGPSDAPLRHHSLRNAIYRSYALLGEREQTLFRTLGIFIAGFDLEVVAHFGFSEVELQVLINKNLVKMVGRNDDQPRFFLLETLREYAREQLTINDEMPYVQQHHAHYFLTLAENTQLRIVNREQKIWHEHLERDQDNLRAALHYYLTTNTEAALQLAASLGEFWYCRGHNSEGQKYLRQALAQNRGILSPVRGKALREAGRIALVQGDYAQATILLEESLNLARQLGDKYEIAASLNFRGHVALYQLDLIDASPFFEQSLALSQELGNRTFIATALNGLGLVAMYQGDCPKARMLLEESLAIHHSIGNVIGTENSLVNLGYNELHQGNPHNALEYFKKGIEVSLKQGDKEGVAYCLEGLAEIVGLYGEGPEHNGKSARLFGAAAASRNILGTPLPPMDRAFYDRSMAAIHLQLEDTLFATAWAEGQAMTLEEAVKVALANSSLV